MKKILAMLLAMMMLVSCAAAAGITNSMTVEWDGAYDVVVIGFGGAGAVAAKNAAEAGAKVLLLEKAPEGHEGGNTRYSGQMFVYGKGNLEATREYYKALGGDLPVPEAMLNVYTEGIANLKDIVAEQFDLDTANMADTKIVTPSNAAMSPEYPEFPGSESIELWAAHLEGTSDGYLWQQMREEIVENSDNIDVWFESPAVHLIQEPTTKTILGVQVERAGKVLNIRANNGVVMAMGGFENNAAMVETYLGLSDVSVMGSMYNTGDGVRMAIEVGADLWHMHVFEALGGGLGATAPIVGDMQSSYFTSFMPPCNSGSAVLVSGDGTRFLNESESTRHGHIKNGDTWMNPWFPEDMYLVMSAANYQMAQVYPFTLPENYEYTYTGNTIEELASAMGVNAENLAATIANFNTYAETGVDPEFGRPAAAMAVFPAEGPYYAVKLVPVMLNTQGGARRNENAEVLDTMGNPIPHLYSAGEFGGICSNQYQGGGNIAECIIFGRIAGKNAAAPKDALAEGLVNHVETNMIYVPGYETDMKASDYSHIELGENEYLGVGEGGMAGVVVVKVKVVDGKIEAIEIAEHGETPGISDPAFAKIPQAIIDAQSAEVDAISGCTMTSTAIKNAVANALEQVK